MILERKTIEYNGVPLIEKVKVKLPFRYEAIFQNEGCFLFVKGADSLINSATEKTKINSRDAVLLKCGSYFVDWVKNQTSDEVDVIAIHLYADIIRSLYKTELPIALTKRIEGREIKPMLTNALLDQFIDNIYFYFDNRELINKDILELKLRELILILIQSKRIDSIYQLLSEIFTPKSVSIRKVLHAHLYSDFNIRELSRLVGMSESSFKREFKKEYNDSPRNYILNKRIEKAQELLKETKLSLSEIAYHIGFNDALYFSRIFKKRIGISPSEFRSAYF